MALLSRRTSSRWEASRPYLALAVLLSGVACGLAGPGAARAQGPSEYEVKAAFLYNFTKFVEWPPSAFAEGNAPLRLCVLGDDPFGRSLQTVVGEEIEGHKLIVVRTETLARAAGCQVLFVSRSERDRLPQILAPLKSSPVLTVGDTKGFLDQGGIVNFILEGSRVHFEINPTAAEQAGLKISSKLLRLARIAGQKPGP
jgi:hypothetical protein